MHFSVRQYKANVEKLDAETLAKIENEFVPIMRSIPGFHAYRLIDSSNYAVATITAYETEEGTNVLVEKAREWVDANLRHLIDGPPTVLNGEQLFSEMA
ncbi:MAG: hypothetical protein HQ478_13185 [Chloroflexi bacterium]|nr:hypothetical protein [Chloroflexota bacterium]